MTKKDYIELAKVLRLLKAKRSIVEGIMETLARDNPLFSSQRFRDAVYRNELRERPGCKPRPLVEL